MILTRRTVFKIINGIIQLVPILMIAFFSWWTRTKKNICNYMMDIPLGILTVSTKDDLKVSTLSYARSKYSCRPLPESSSVGSFKAYDVAQIRYLIKAFIARYISYLFHCDSKIKHPSTRLLICYHAKRTRQGVRIDNSTWALIEQLFSLRDTYIIARMG